MGNRVTVFILFLQLVMMAANMAALSLTVLTWLRIRKSFSSFNKVNHPDEDPLFPLRGENDEIDERNVMEREEAGIVKEEAWSKVVKADEKMGKKGTRGVPVANGGNDEERLLSIRAFSSRAGGRILAIRLDRESFLLFCSMMENILGNSGTGSRQIQHICCVYERLKMLGIIQPGQKDMWKQAEGFFFLVPSCSPYISRGCLKAGCQKLYSKGKRLSEKNKQDARRRVEIEMMGLRPATCADILHIGAVCHDTPMVEYSFYDENMPTLENVRIWRFLPL